MAKDLYELRHSVPLRPPPFSVTRKPKPTWPRKLGYIAIGLAISAALAILFVIAYMVIFVGLVATYDISRMIGG